MWVTAFKLLSIYDFFIVYDNVPASWNSQFLKKFNQFLELKVTILGKHTKKPITFSSFKKKKSDYGKPVTVSF